MVSPKPFTYLTVHPKWTMSLWVIFIRDLLPVDVGDVSISLTDYCLKYFLCAQYNSRVSLMLSRRINKDSYFRVMKFHWTLLVVSLLPWTLAIWVEPSCLKGLKLCSDLLLSSFPIFSWFVKTCSWPKVLLTPKFLLKNSLLFICSVEIYFLNNSITIGGSELLNQSWSWLVFSKETKLLYLKVPCWWEPWEILTYLKLPLPI